MRAIFFGLFAAFLAALTPAEAQTSITVQANPIPIVDAQINGQAVRLEIDFRPPDVSLLNPAAAQRLHIFQMFNLSLQVDSGASIRGRLARPRMTFQGNQASRAFAGVFAIPVTSRADGVIGPGVLPEDVITIVLGPDIPNARTITLPLANADVWTSAATAGGLGLRTNFDLGRQESVFNVTAARTFNEQNKIASDGDLIDREVILGLTTKVQPVRTELMALGLALSPAYARTNEPLHGAEDENAVVVTAHAPPPPGMTIGRAALSHCSSISVDRRTKQMTLRCA